MANEPIGVELNETVCAFDATTIDLCLSVFPWAPFQRSKGAIRLHTLLDLRGSIPTFIHISDGKTHEVRILDALTPEPGAFYLFDRGYLDFARLHHLPRGQRFFLIRAKQGLRFKRRYSQQLGRRTPLFSAIQIGVLEVFSSQRHSDPLLRHRGPGGVQPSTSLS